MNSLCAPLQSGAVRLEPLEEHHRAALKDACAADPDIWEIYSRNFGPDGFDAEFDRLLSNDWVPFAALADGRVVGMSSYIGIDSGACELEIGATYFHPDMRGTAYNRTVKDLMIRHARDCGFRRIVFRVDARNGRSQAAVLKLGAKKVATLEDDVVTWTGYRRDSVRFELDANDWRG